MQICFVKNISPDFQSFGLLSARKSIYSLLHFNPSRFKVHSAQRLLECTEPVHSDVFIIRYSRAGHKTTDILRQYTFYKQYKNIY